MDLLHSQSQINLFILHILYILTFICTWVSGWAEKCSLNVLSNELLIMLSIRVYCDFYCMLNRVIFHRCNLQL